MSEQWIDVSAHQGAIDWPRVAAAGVKGAILRAGYGDDIRQQDTQFAANIKGATSAGLKVAVYWFSYADSSVDAQKEWGVCKQVIGPYKDKILFVACDYEYDSVNYFRKIHGTAPSNALINQIVNAFLGAANADGYAGVLYTNNDYRLHIFTAATLAAWDVWLADYSGGPDINCAIQQTGSTGRVDGIGGDVDMNTVFKEYGAAALQTIVVVDTSGTYRMAVGDHYQLKTTCPQQPRVWSARPDIVLVLPRLRMGNEDFWYLVAVGGKPGDQVGIYSAAPGEDGLRRMIVEVK